MLSSVSFDTTSKLRGSFDLSRRVWILVIPSFNRPIRSSRFESPSEPSPENIFSNCGVSAPARRPDPTTKAMVAAAGNVNVAAAMVTSPPANSKPRSASSLLKIFDDPPLEEPEDLPDLALGFLGNLPTSAKARFIRSADCLVARSVWANSYLKRLRSSAFPTPANACSISRAAVMVSRLACTSLL